MATSKYNIGDKIFVLDNTSISIAIINSIVIESTGIYYWLADDNGIWGDSVIEGNITKDFNDLLPRFKL